MIKKFLRKLKKYIGLIVLFIGLIAGLALVRTVQIFRQKAATPVPNLTLSPASQNIAPGGNFTFTVRMNTGTESVWGLEMYINYDPSAIQINSITKGSGITNFDTVAVNTIDNSVGKISYVVFTTDLSKSITAPDAEVIIISGNVKPGITSGSFPLSFDPNTTKMGGTGGNSVLAGTAPGTVNVSVSVTPTIGATPTPPTVNETLFDNFETYGTTLALRAVYIEDETSEGASVSLNSANKVEGTYSMAFNYTLGIPPYAGVLRNLGAVDWSQYNGLKFWFKGNASGNKFSVILKESSGEYWESSYTLNSATAGYITIPFSTFVRPSWYSGGGNNIFEKNSISQIGFRITKVTATATGTVYIDNINLYSGGVITTPTPPGPTNTPGATKTPTPTTGIQQPADTTLSISPAQSTRTVGEQFTLSININTGINEVVGVELYMSFNPSILTVVDIVPGGFFINPVTTVKQVDNTTGKMEYVLHIPPQQAAQRGTGTLALLTFRGLAEGTSSVTFDSTSIVGAINTGAKNALKSATGATVTIIRPSLPGDINDMGTYCGDGRVDILDYVILFENFAETPTDHRCADINKDGTVNILDYVILFENFGRSL